MNPTGYVIFENLDISQNNSVPPSPPTSPFTFHAGINQSFQRYSRKAAQSQLKGQGQYLLKKVSEVTIYGHWNPGVWMEILVLMHQNLVEWRIWSTAGSYQAQGHWLSFPILKLLLKSLYYFRQYSYSKPVFLFKSIV